jgi:hypothetical protein
MRTRAGGVLLGAAQCGKRPSPAIISILREVFVQQDHKPLLPILRAFAREDRYPRLAEIGVPTVVMVGSADRTAPPSHGRLAAEMPGARLVIVPDAGAHAELGGLRRAGRRRRVVPRVARAGCLSDRTTNWLSPIDRCFLRSGASEISAHDVVRPQLVRPPAAR